MSFWVGLVIIVLFLETLRIGLSSFLLIHILRGLQPGGQLLAPADATSHAASGIAWSRERDRLASEAMLAVRQALDSSAAPGAAQTFTTAIAALDAYVLHHVDEGRA